MSTRLRIAEVFASLQGEGIWSGVPSTFIRVSGCNLRCIWCDTPYASWAPEGEMVEIDELVQAAAENDLDHVVLTGGEPMLFDAIEPLAQALAHRGHTITIETAGTIYRDLPCDLMSISPKLANSVPHEDSGWKERHDRDRIDIAVLRRLVTHYPHQLKFVVNPEAGQDVGEIEELLSELPALEPQRIHLMPEGTDPAVLLRRSRMLVKECMSRNWRLSPRLHVDLFGNTRGT